MILESILTCPNCSHQKQEKLLENTFPTRFRCGNCQEMAEVKLGDCCIYCSFGDIPCLQSQIEGSSCCS